MYERMASAARSSGALKRLACLLLVAAGTKHNRRIWTQVGGGAQHITQSLANVARYAPPGHTAPNFKGAIGVTADSVEGVDITVPVYHFAETHYLADAVVTLAYKLTLFALTGRVNNSAFKGFAAGECLFLGAAGTKRGSGDWEIGFRFASSPNVTGLTVGDITGINKKD